MKNFEDMTLDEKRVVYHDTGIRKGDRGHSEGTRARGKAIRAEKIKRRHANSARLKVIREEMGLTY